MPTSLAVKNEIAKFDRQAKAAFFNFFSVKKKAVLARFGPLFEVQPSTGPDEKYPFPRATPQLVEYSEGEVPVSQFSAETLTITNRLFGNSVAIGRTFFEDIDRMPGARAQYLQQVSGLGIRGANYVIKLMADILLAEGIFSGTTAYDGNSLFDTGHSEGSNLFTGGSAVTTAQLTTEHNGAMDLFTAQKDPDGHDFLREESPNAVLLIVDPNELTAYQQFYRATIIPDVGGIAASVINVLAPANANLLQGTTPNGQAATIVGWARFRAKNTTVMVDMSGEIPGPAPIIHQERIAPVLETVGVGDITSETFVIAEQSLWKVRMRGMLGIGNYNKIIKIDKT